MGQRLVITVKEKRKEIAKIYYHWSGYTVSAYYVAKDIIDYLEYYKNKRSSTALKLIRCCEENGGGVDSYDLDAVKKIYPKAKFKEDVHRNDGLVALTEKGMADLQRWSEGDLTIDLDDRMVYNDVFFSYGGIDEYRECIGENDDSDIYVTEVPKDIDILGCPFEDVEKAADFVSEHVDDILKCNDHLYLECIR